MSRKTQRDKDRAGIVVACDPITEVWAVCDYTPECHDYECDCSCGVEGSMVLALFLSEQTAEQYVERKGRGWKRKMPVNTAMKHIY